jgi:MFS family permease
MKYITKTVWILSLVSLFTDISSEMLYPIMPLYLKSIGFSIVLIGLLEGVAEAITGFSKGYFGKLSDSRASRLPFVQVGYLLSAISKPMMAFLAVPIWVFIARTTDRLGKGIRSAARDAILSHQATPTTKAKVFGFHRALDTLGAAIGPLIALWYLYYHPANYKTLFIIAFIPAIIAVICTWFIKEKKEVFDKKKINVAPFAFITFWKTSTHNYRKLVIGLLVFTIFNSSDVFLLLNAKQSGLSDTDTICLYIFYNLIYALFAFPLGVLADKIGFKKIFIFGLVAFAVTYFGMSFCTQKVYFYALFFIYGIYAAATEGVSKAWISNTIDKKDTATAIGTFASFQSICTMLASTMAGLLWYQYGPAAVFAITAIGAIVVILYFIWYKPVQTN